MSLFDTSILLLQLSATGLDWNERPSDMRVSRPPCLGGDQGVGLMEDSIEAMEGNCGLMFGVLTIKATGNGLEAP